MNLNNNSIMEPTFKIPGPKKMKEDRCWNCDHLVDRHGYHVGCMWVNKNVGEHFIKDEECRCGFNIDELRKQSRNSINYTFDLI